MLKPCIVFAVDDPLKSPPVGVEPDGKPGLPICYDDKY